MDSQYEYFALHDFIYITDKRNDFQNSLESKFLVILEEVIDLDPYFNNKTSDSLEKLLNDKIDDIQLKYYIPILEMENLKIWYNIFNRIHLHTKDTYILIPLKS